MQTKDFRAKAEDGYEILLRWYFKVGSDASSKGPAILHIHGGGMIGLSVETLDAFPKVYVAQTGVPMLSVDYRLAPEVKAPVPMKDCYAGLEFLVAHADELGVDSSRIAVMGESAGGGLAASLTHYAKAKGGPAICKQVLVYPMLDDRTQSIDRNTAPYLMWDVNDNITGWQAMLGDAAGGPDVPAIHAPARMTVEEAVGPPPTYVDVGQLDLFRDEDIEYVRKLGLAGVDVTFHLYPGMPHAFESIAKDAKTTRFAMEQRVKALTSF